jgi:esterase/lipase
MWSLQESKARFEHSAPAFRIPALVVQSTSDVGVYPSDAKHVFELLASQDKEFHLVPGGHFFEDNEKCLSNVIEMICEWTDKKL